MSFFRIRSWSILVLLLTAPAVFAQWKTETLHLEQGWNAVYLHVDPSHATIAELVHDQPISEIWLWRTRSSQAQFSTSVQDALDPGSDWLVWKRGNSVATSLHGMIGNAGYLIHATAKVSWKIKGIPVPPSYQWTSTGENLIGFSSPESSASGLAPTFNRLLSHAPGFQDVAEVFGVSGVQTSPEFHKINTKGPGRLVRGQAFWIRSPGVFNDYFAPFQLRLQNPRGLFFGKSGGGLGIEIRNQTASDLTVTLTYRGSETQPSGQTANTGLAPLIVREPLNVTTLTSSSTNLAAGGHYTIKLKPKDSNGSTTNIVFGVDRSKMNGSAGDVFSGLLSVTDSLHLSDYMLPVQAVQPDVYGLWLGEARVTQVAQDLQQAAMTNGKPQLNADGSVMVTNTITSLGAVQRSFPLRLIVHVSTNGTTRLLQRVYLGLSSNLTASVVSTDVDSLHQGHLDLARRISSIHLPWKTANGVWVNTNQSGLGSGTNLTFVVGLPFDDQASNPFLHTYHPDHDNRSADFKPLTAKGEESYGVQRVIKLVYGEGGSDFDSLANNSETIAGTYNETIEMIGQGTKTFRVAGDFHLTRISSVGHLSGLSNP